MTTEKHTHSLQSKRSTVRRAALSVTLLSGVIGLGAQPWQYDPSKTVILSQEHRTQAHPSNENTIRAYVHKALEWNGKSRDLSTWQSSGYLPSQVLSYVQDLRSNEAWQNFCDALSELNPSELGLFESEINLPKNNKLMPCASQLTLRLREFWEKSKEHAEEQNAPFEAFSTETRKLSEGLGEKEINLSFNQGPHTASQLERTLEILEQHGVHANFFATGQSASDSSDLWKRAAQEGHVIGSQSWSGGNLLLSAMNTAKNELTRGRNAVEMAAGNPAPFFRFPYGVKTAALEALAHDTGLTQMPWDIDSLNWKHRDASAIVEHTLAQIEQQKGGTILFQDLQEQTLIALPTLLNELRMKGYRTIVFGPGT